MGHSRSLSKKTFAGRRRNLIRFCIPPSLLLLLVAGACVPAGTSPTSAPPQAPAPTAAQSAAKPAATAAVAQPAAKPTEKPGANREALLKPLLEAAQKEGELSLHLEGSISNQTIVELESSFNKFYGLNIKFKPDPASGLSQKSTQAITEAKTGVTPTYDVQVGNATHVGNMAAAGALEKVENWDQLLPQGTPRSVSPGPMAGIAFAWSDTWFGMVYNTRLMPKEQLPRTMKDLGDPRFKGRFTMRSNGGQVYSQAVLLYEPKEVVEIARSWGKNGVEIIDTGDGGGTKVGLGELAIATNTSEGQFSEAKATGNPVGRAYFQDNVPFAPQYYVMRKGARHPNLAKLWLAWAVSPQAFSIWKKQDYLNSLYPEQSLEAAQVLKTLKEGNYRLADWFADAKSAEKLQWLTASDEGRAHQQAVQDGLTGR